MSKLFPEGFESLAPFAGRWAVETVAERAALRGASTREERQAFYNVVAPQAAAALDYLDQRGMDRFDAADRRLMHLMLCFVHVAIAVEIQREDEEAHTAARHHMQITRSPSDQAPV